MRESPAIRRPKWGRTFGAAALAAAFALAPALVPSPAKAEPVKVTARTDRGSGRLVLRWRRPVRYTVARSAPFVFIRFARPLEADLAAAKHALRRYLIELRLAGNGRVLVLRVAGQPRFVHYRRGNAVTLIWIGVGHTPPPPGENPTNSEERTKPPVKAEIPAVRRPASPPARRSPAQRSPAPPQRAGVPPPLPPNPAAPPKKAAEAPAKPPTPPNKQQHAAQPKTPPATAARMPPAWPMLTVSHDGAATTISLSTPEETGAAVFRYGANVWIVFSRRATFDLAPHRDHLGPGIQGLTQIENAQASVLLVRARADIRAKVTRRSNQWSIVLAPGGPPQESADLMLKLTRGTVDQVTIPLPGADAPISVVAPVVGSTLHIVPSRAAAAIAANRRFVTFRIMAAAQGAVIEDLADGLGVSAKDDALVIRRRGGLLLSVGPPASGAQQSQ